MADSDRPNVDAKDNGSVNVESRTSSQDKRWTIMAALLGTNTALMLFHGLQQEVNYSRNREISLTIIASALPFQAVYFMVYTYVLENGDSIAPKQDLTLRRVSALCQVVAYFSLIGVTMLWYNLSTMVGITFLVATALAIIMVRIAMYPSEE